MQGSPQSIPGAFFSLSPFRRTHFFTIHKCPRMSITFLSCSFINAISLARNTCSVFICSSSEAEPKPLLLNEVSLIIKGQVLTDSRRWAQSCLVLQCVVVYIYLLSLVELQCAFWQEISIHIFALPRVLRCRALCIVDIQLLVDWLIILTYSIITSKGASGKPRSTILNKPPEKNIMKWRLTTISCVNALRMKVVH